MKQEISPVVIGVVITLVVIVIGVFAYRQIVTNPPSVHPQYGSGNAASTPTAAPAGGH